MSDNGTEFVLPAKVWIRVGATDVQASDPLVELYSDEPVRLRYREPVRRTAGENR